MYLCGQVVVRARDGLDASALLFLSSPPASSSVSFDPPQGNLRSLLPGLVVSMSDNETYEVSHIVDEDYSNPKQRLFLVRWLGYTPEYDSWEPLKNLIPSAVEVIKEWDRKQKQAQKRKAQENKTNGAQKKTRQSPSQTSDESREETAGRVKTSQTVRIVRELALILGAQGESYGDDYIGSCQQGF